MDIPEEIEPLLDSIESFATSDACPPELRQRLGSLAVAFAECYDVFNWDEAPSLVAEAWSIGAALQQDAHSLEESEPAAPPAGSAAAAVVQDLLDVSADLLLWCFCPDLLVDWALEVGGSCLQEAWDSVHQLVQPALDSGHEQLQLAVLEALSHVAETADEVQDVHLRQEDEDEEEDEQPQPPLQPGTMAKERLLGVLQDDHLSAAVRLAVLQALPRLDEMGASCRVKVASALIQLLLLAEGSNSLSSEQVHQVQAGLWGALRVQPHMVLQPVLLPAAPRMLAQLQQALQHQQQQEHSAGLTLQQLLVAQVLARTLELLAHPACPAEAALPASTTGAAAAALLRVALRQASSSDGLKPLDHVLWAIGNNQGAAALLAARAAAARCPGADPELAARVWGTLAAVLSASASRQPLSAWGRDHTRSGARVRQHLQPLVKQLVQEYLISQLRAENVQQHMPAAEKAAAAAAVPVPAAAAVGPPVQQQQGPAAAALPAGCQQLPPSGQRSQWQDAAERALLQCLRQCARCAARWLPDPGARDDLARSLMLQAIRCGHWAMAHTAVRMLHALNAAAPVLAAARVSAASDGLLALLAAAGAGTPSSCGAAPDGLFEALLSLLQKASLLSAGWGWEAAWQAAQAACSACIPALFKRLAELHELPAAPSSSASQQGRLDLCTCRIIRVLAVLRCAGGPAELQRSKRLQVLEALLELPWLQQQVGVRCAALQTCCIDILSAYRL
jgi:hypothetical protein